MPFNSLTSRTRRTVSRHVLSAVALAALGAVSLPSIAQTAWPSKPVKIIVPFAPGGTTDILARAVAPELTKAFGQPFIVENRAGAGGNVGADAVAKAPADGYTLLMGTVGTHAINKGLHRVPRTSMLPVVNERDSGDRCWCRLDSQCSS